MAMNLDMLNAIAARAAAVSEQRSNAAVDPEDEEEDVGQRFAAERLTPAEKLALGTFDAVFKKRMKQLDPANPPTITRLLYDPPAKLTRAMIRASAPKLAHVLQTAQYWRERAPLASLTGSTLDVLPDLPMNFALCYLPINDLATCGLCCKYFAAAPSTPFFFQALAGPFRSLFEGGVIITPAEVDEEASLIELSLMLCKFQKFFNRGLGEADQNIPGAPLLMELNQLPRAKLSFDAYAYLCHARPQLDAERERLRVLQRALAVLNSGEARAQVSAFLGVAVALGTSLAGIDPESPDAPKGFHLPALEKLRTVKCRFHPTLTLGDFLAAVAVEHHASIDPQVADQLQCLVLGYDTLPQLAGHRTSIAAKVSEVQGLRKSLRRWLGKEQQARVREGIERYLWMLQLLQSELDDAARVSRGLVVEYVKLREFIQGEAQAPTVHPFSSCLIDNQHAREDFRKFVESVTATVTATVTANPQQQREEAEATWIRAKEAGLLEPPAKPVPSSPPLPPAAAAADQPDKGSQATAPAPATGAPEVPAAEPLEPPSGKSPAFNQLRASVAGKFNARVDASARVSTSGPLDTSPEAVARRSLRQWTWEPSRDAPSQVFAHAPPSQLTAGEADQMKRLFTRGAFVGMDLVRGQKPKSHFTMERFTNEAPTKNQTDADQSAALPTATKLKQSAMGVTGGGGRVLTGFFNTNNNNDNSNKKSTPNATPAPAPAGPPPTTSATSATPAASLGGSGGGGGSKTAPSGATMSLAELRACKASGELAARGLDPSQLEAHLAPEDYVHAFSMDAAQFAALPKWRRQKLKKDAGLF